MLAALKDLTKICPRVETCSLVFHERLVRYLKVLVGLYSRLKVVFSQFRRLESLSRLEVIVRNYTSREPEPTMLCLVSPEDTFCCPDEIQSPNTYLIRQDDGVWEIRVEWRRRGILRCNDRNQLSSDRAVLLQSTDHIAAMLEASRRLCQH